MRRLIWADAARGAAALLVILGHILPQSSGKAWIFSFHVPFFFFLSGYLMAAGGAWQRQDLKTFFRKRALSLMYPYYTFSAATILLQLILRDYMNMAISMVFTLLLFGAQSLWFLPAMFFGELLVTAALKKYSGARRLLFFLAVGAISCAVCMVFHPSRDSGILQKVFNNEIIFLNRILLGCVWMGIGFGAFPLVEKLGEGNRSLIPAVLLAAVSFLGAQFNFAEICANEIGNPVLYYLNGISGCLGMLLVFRAVGDRCRFLPYCGRNSLILFATHQNLRITELGSSFLPDGISFVLTVAIELLLIAVIRRYLPFMLAPVERKIQKTI